MKAHSAAIKSSKKAKSATVATTMENVLIIAVIRETSHSVILISIEQLRRVLDELLPNAGMV